MNTKSGSQHGWDLTDTPDPLLSRQVALASLKPGESPTPARFKTLRDKDQFSSGITVTRRSGGHANGRESVHSALVVLSGYARREGDLKTAERLMTEAGNVEKEFAEPLKAFLAYRTLDDLPEADFYPALVKATSRSLKKVRAWSRHVFATGVLRELNVSSGVVETRTESGVASTVDLPAELLSQWRLGEGDHMYVFRSMLGHSVVVDVLPAARLSDTEKFNEATWKPKSAEDIKRLREFAATRSGKVRHLRPAG